MLTKQYYNVIAVRIHIVPSVINFIGSY